MPRELLRKNKHSASILRAKMPRCRQEATSALPSHATTDLGRLSRMGQSTAVSNAALAHGPTSLNMRCTPTDLLTRMENLSSQSLCAVRHGLVIMKWAQDFDDSPVGQIQSESHGLLPADTLLGHHVIYRELPKVVIKSLSR